MRDAISELLTLLTSRDETDTDTSYKTTDDDGGKSCSSKLWDTAKKRRQTR